MHALLRLTELRALERATAAHLPSGELMRRAGRSAASEVHALLPAIAAPRVLVLCGPGDNGGDGFVCATALREAGADAVCWAPRPGTSADTRQAHAAAQAAGVPVLDALPRDPAWDAVVDAVFGIGLTRPPEAPWSDGLRWAAQLGVPVLAIDMPSGLDADTGCWLGGRPLLRATRTLSLLADKPGLHMADPATVGHLVIDRIGALAPGQSPGRRVQPGDFDPLLVPRAWDAHKGRLGEVCVVGGGPSMAGAALLAARAALRLGAGRVHVDMLGGDCRLDPQQPELMFRTQDQVAPGAVRVVGCGLGQDAKAATALRACLAQPGPLVLDADALNLLARDEGLRELLRARTALSLLTPHPLEAARLLGTDVGSVQADRIGAAIRLAREFRSRILLKGAASVHAGTDGSWAINPTGGPALATAGSGDVLAGMIGAMLAQGVDDATAALGAAWLHGRAGELAGGDLGLVAGEIAPLAVAELQRLRAGAA